MKRKHAIALLAPSALLWLAAVIAPLIFLLRLSLFSSGDRSGEKQMNALLYQAGTWSLESFSKILSEPFYVRLYGFTFVLALTITAITLLAGYVLGYAVYRSGARAKVALILFIALPKFTNILVYVYGIKIIFGTNGFFPVVAGEVLLLTPYAALTIAAALEAVPYSLVEAARGLGASRWSAFRRVTLPLSMPGVSAAATLTLLWSASAFLGPYLLGQPSQYTVAVVIERQMHQDLNWPIAAALNVILIAILAATAYGASLARRKFV